MAAFTHSKTQLLVLAWVILFAAVGCTAVENGVGDSDGGDADTDADTDSDSDTDTDADTDTDTDTDTDIDTNTDTDTDTDTETDTDTSTDFDTDTGLMGDECVVDDDCALHSDCCSCYSYPADTPQMGCMMACIPEAAPCFVAGITSDDVVCRKGVCVMDVRCDESTTTCDQAISCPTNMVPEVTADGTCYTGRCVQPADCADL